MHSARMRQLMQLDKLFEPFSKLVKGGVVKQHLLCSQIFVVLLFFMTITISRAPGLKYLIWTTQILRLRILHSNSP